MKPVTIIGGGLAGLTLGILLRNQAVPVRIFEAGTYPRHRVCGEFISGHGLSTIERLGLALFKRGAICARTVGFFNRRQLGRFTLPEPALCVSRYVLDAALAERFVELGGELVCGRRMVRNADNEGCVRATGRAVHGTTNGWRWFGLKAHATRVQLSADLEMHFRKDAYVGICRLDEDTVNVCGLIRNRPGSGGQLGDWKAQLTGPSGSSLSGRLAGAAWRDETFCAVSGLRYTVEPNVSECAIGDSFSLIAPVTGNGMSLAFESAELVSAPLVAYARGQSLWAETVRAVGSSLHACFGGRLQRAKLFQAIIFHPLIGRFLLPLLLCHRGVINRCYRATRS
jgi:menaquinone-9 beta-reductase